MATDFYSVLRIPPHAQATDIEEAIKRGYIRGLDRAVLTQAFQILLDPFNRRHYDQWLRNGAHGEFQRPSPVVPPVTLTQPAPPEPLAVAQERPYVRMADVVSPSAPVNPYSPPRAEVADNRAGAAVPQHKLFTVGGIGIATFLGSLIAGGILLAHNYRRLGNLRAANQVLLGCIALTVVIIAVSLALPFRIGGMGLSMPQLIAIVYYARYQQGGRISAHKEAGGKVVSNWLAAGVGLLVLAVLAATALAVVLLLVLFGVIAL